MFPCPTSAGWVNATARAVANQPMSSVSGINRPAQVSLRPWDFDLGNPGTGSTQYLVFGSSAGEASVNVKSRMPTDRENWLTTSCPLSPACLFMYVHTALSGSVRTVLCFISRTIVSTEAIRSFRMSRCYCCDGAGGWRPSGRGRC